MQLIFRVSLFIFARLVVIFAIGIAVTWGGLFNEPFEWIKGGISWLIIWAAIDYYIWHIRRFENK